MNMATLFLQYPACSTCQKAKKWLTENNIEFTNRLIVELLSWICGDEKYQRREKEPAKY